jgi:hypothetical protein
VVGFRGDLNFLQKTSAAATTTQQQQQQQQVEEDCERETMGERETKRGSVGGNGKKLEDLIHCKMESK